MVCSLFNLAFIVWKTICFSSSIEICSSAFNLLYVCFLDTIGLKSFNLVSLLFKPEFCLEVFLFGRSKQQRRGEVWRFVWLCNFFHLPTYNLSLVVILIPKNTRWRTSLDTQGAAGLLLGDGYEGGVVFNPAGIFCDQCPRYVICMCYFSGGSLR